jgi:hypothetical protein
MATNPRKISHFHIALAGLRETGGGAETGLGLSIGVGTGLVMADIAGPLRTQTGLEI